MPDPSPEQMDEAVKAAYNAMLFGQTTEEQLEAAAPFLRDDLEAEVERLTRERSQIADGMDHYHGIARNLETERDAGPLTDPASLGGLFESDQEVDEFLQWAQPTEPRRLTVEKIAAWLNENGDTEAARRILEDHPGPEKYQ